MARKRISAILLPAFLLSAILFCHHPASAQERGVGLGIVLGQPTGISLKGWITRHQAVVGGLAWSLGWHDSLHVHADYIYHDFSLIKLEEGKLPIYFGIGGRFKLGDHDEVYHDEDDEDRIGIRIPVGVDYLFRKYPIDIFLEVVPILDLMPETAFSLNAGIGARFFFEPAK